MFALQLFFIFCSICWKSVVANRWRLLFASVAKILIHPVFWSLSIVLIIPCMKLKISPWSSTYKVNSGSKSGSQTFFLSKFPEWSDHGLNCYSRNEQIYLIDRVNLAFRLRSLWFYRGFLFVFKVTVIRLLTMYVNLAISAFKFVLIICRQILKII